MFYDSKMFKEALLSFTFFPNQPFAWAQPARVRGALAWPTLPGYHALNGSRPCAGRARRFVGRRGAGRSLSPLTVVGTLSGRCIVH